MADTDQVSINYEEESVEGTINGSPSTTAIRFTGESLKQNTEVEIPAEIDPSAQIVSAPVRTNVNAGGDLNFLSSFGTYDDFWEATLRGTWAAPVTVISASMLVEVTNSTTLTLSSGTWTNTPVVGSWIQIAGFTSQTQSTMFVRVSAATTTTITSAFAILTTEAEGDSVTITQLGRTTNGTTERGFTIEKKFANADGAGTDEWARYVGCVFGGASLNATIRQSLQGSFTVLGRSEASAAAALDGTPTSAPTGNVFSTVSDIPFLLEDTARISTGTEFTVAMTNNLRDEGALGVTGAHRIGRGRFEASGTLLRYFLNEALIDKYLNWTTSGIALVVTNSDGTNIYDFPAIKYTDGSRTADGPNQSVIARMTWQAYKHATYGFSAQIARTA